MNLIHSCTIWMKEYMTISEMARFRFPGEMGEPTERDRRLGSILVLSCEKEYQNFIFGLVE